MTEVPESGRVAILDRDGTIVIDRGYLDDAAGLEFEPGAAEGLRFLYDRGYRLVVITNQSGVGRGYFPVERVHAMNERLRTMVKEAGAHLEAIYFCPHAPEAGCACRKPRLGLFALAARELRFDAASSVVIGDKPSDIEFGRLAGATTILIAPPSRLTSAESRPDLVAPNLLSAAVQIVALHASPA